VSLSTTTAGSTLRYTTDGSTPTTSTGTVYSGPIAVSANSTIKAIAYQNGMVASDVVSATYAIITTTLQVPSQYSTVQAAVNAVVSNSPTTTLIQIAAGTYNEAVLVPAGKNNLIFLGQPDRSQVVITNAIVNATNGYTGALQLRGNDILVENLTLQNTAGVTAGPANALFTSGQRLTFRNVAVLGYQDTAAIWNNTLAYFTNCEIDGSVDFIYSGGTAFFDNCLIRQIRTTSPYGGVNAAPSTPLNTRGFVFNNCIAARIAGVPDGTSTLMRPWGNFGESAYVNCDLDAHISAAGWGAWGGRELTCRAAEYGSTTLSGATIDLTTRASWADTTLSGVLAAYTPSAVLGGWDPAAGAPTFQIYAVNSGGTATGRFAADAYYSGGSSYSTTATIDTSAVTNPAPQAVYQTERHGSTGFTYTLPSLTPGQAYTVRLHFAEIYWSTSGSRLFNVAINGTTVLSNFDVFATAGAKYKAVVKEFTAYANSSGQIVIGFTTVKDGAKVSGIELLQ
jgi:pectin methylesterase-like acyl-CoA thioesterase